LVVLALQLLMRSMLYALAVIEAVVLTSKAGFRRKTFFYAVESK
jgi:hypothetical protein